MPGGGLVDTRIEADTRPMESRPSLLTRAEQVALLIHGLFAAAAAITNADELRAHPDAWDIRQRARVSIAPSSVEVAVSLEVSSEAGDWQRNLVVTIAQSSEVCRIDVKITDEERRPIVSVAFAEVDQEDAAHVAFIVARAGVGRLQREVALQSSHRGRAIMPPPADRHEG